MAKENIAPIVVQGIETDCEFFSHFEVRCTSGAEVVTKRGEGYNSSGDTWVLRRVVFNHCIAGTTYTFDARAVDTFGGASSWSSTTTETAGDTTDPAQITSGDVSIEIVNGIAKATIDSSYSESDYIDYYLWWTNTTSSHPGGIPKQRGKSREFKFPVNNKFYVYLFIAAVDYSGNYSTSYTTYVRRVRTHNIGVYLSPQVADTNKSLVITGNNDLNTTKGRKPSTSSPVAAVHPRYGRVGGKISVSAATTNLMSGSTDFETGNWNDYLSSVVTVTDSQEDPFGGLNGYRIETSGGTNELKYYFTTGAAGARDTDDPVSHSVWIKVLNDTTLTVLNNCTNDSQDITKADGWTWVRIEGYTISDGRHNQMQFRSSAAGNDLDFYAYQPQMEDLPVCTDFCETSRGNPDLDYEHDIDINNDSWTLCGWFQPPQDKTDLLASSTAIHGNTWEYNAVFDLLSTSKVDRLDCLWSNWTGGQSALYVELGDGTAEHIGATDYSKDDWVFIAVVGDGYDVTWYCGIDGVDTSLDSSTTTTRTGDLASDNKIYLGYNSTTGYVARNGYSDIMMVKDALSAEELNSMFIHGTVVDPDEKKIIYDDYNRPILDINNRTIQSIDGVDIFDFATDLADGSLEATLVFGENGRIYLSDQTLSFTDVAGTEIIGKGIQVYGDANTYAKLAYESGSAIIEVVGGTISGGTIQSSSGGDRIVLNSADNRIDFYESSSLDTALEINGGVLTITKVGAGYGSLYVDDIDSNYSAQDGYKYWYINRTSGEIVLGKAVSETGGPPYSGFEGIKINDTPKISLYSEEYFTTFTHDIYDNAGSLQIDTTGSIILGSDNNYVRPATDGDINLGSSSYRWNNVYAVDMNVDDDLTVTDQIVNNHLVHVNFTNSGTNGTRTIDIQVVNNADSSISDNHVINFWINDNSDPADTLGTIGDWGLATFAVNNGVLISPSSMDEDEYHKAITDSSGTFNFTITTNCEATASTLYIHVEVQGKIYSNSFTAYTIDTG